MNHALTIITPTPAPEERPNPARIDIPLAFGEQVFAAGASWTRISSAWLSPSVPTAMHTRALDQLDALISDLGALRQAARGLG